jgi:hypothetical protein
MTLREAHPDDIRQIQSVRKAGWKETGTHGRGEIKFEMTCDNWVNRRRAP